MGAGHLTIESPYNNPLPLKLKGNMHAHTTKSDGRLSPEDLVRTYREAGYDWLIITDHDLVTQPSDSTGNLILLPGNEITAGGGHILHVGTRERIEPLADRAEVIRRARDAGGLIVINHPRWSSSYNHWPVEAIKGLPRFDGIEIYNGIMRREPGSPLATDCWDRLLSQGVRSWGYANDDFHKDIDLGLGWNVAMCEEATGDAILESLATGQFYASTGVVLSRLETEGTTVRISCQNESVCVPIIEHSIESGRYPGDSWEFDLEELCGERKPSYVRFEIHGAGMAVAWTQPIFLFWS